MRIGSGMMGMDLTAIHNLSSAYQQLNETAVRMATFKAINRGSDNPAGLIAAEELRSELVALEEAGRNASRAVGAVHVADAGLSEVGNLLNTIRGNIVEVAGGNLSDVEVDAKQMEIDAALEAINRIGYSTSYGGRKLLGGDGGYETSGVNDQQVTDLQVHYKAGDGDATPGVEVTEAATAATMAYTNESGALAEDTTLMLSGDEGTVTLEFGAGATLDQMATAVNAATDSTGVEAAVEDNTLTLSSVEVGSEATVSVEAIEGTFDVDQATVSGTDVVVTVDGAEFVGQGNRVEVSTETLQADFEFAEGFSGEVDPITVSGDAMTFLFSPDPSNTVSLSLPHVNASALGGASGRLGDLASGGSASLGSGNFAAAMAVVDEAQDQVLSARAEAGAFERFTIESSQRVIDSMEESLTGALSRLADADLAEEASNMVRAQLLTQAATSSLLLGGQTAGNMAGLLFSF
jgi:flagellin